MSSKLCQRFDIFIVIHINRFPFLYRRLQWIPTKHYSDDWRLTKCHIRIVLYKFNSLCLYELIKYSYFIWILVFWLLLCIVLLLLKTVRISHCWIWYNIEETTNEYWSLALNRYLLKILILHTKFISPYYKYLIFSFLIFKKCLPNQLWVVTTYRFILEFFNIILVYILHILICDCFELYRHKIICI